MPAQPSFRKDQLPIERDLESSFRRRDEGHLTYHWGPTIQQLVRQTDGARNVVSGNAEFDLKTVPGVEHSSPP